MMMEMTIIMCSTINIKNQNMSDSFDKTNSLIDDDDVSDDTVLWESDPGDTGLLSL